jgi:diguanylate cyclase (GGDEF)-like protein
MSISLSRIWTRLTKPVRGGDARDAQFSRLLNIILLVLLALTVVFEVQYRLRGGFIDTRDAIVLFMLGILGLAYGLNQRGYLLFATITLLGLLIVVTFALAVLLHFEGIDDLAILHYLIVAILIGELFLSTRGYLITVCIIFAGVLGLSMINPGAAAILPFLLIFCALITFSSYSRHSVERQQAALAGQFAREQGLLTLEQRRSAQLGLLEEAGRQIAASLNEREILQRTVEAIVNRFGYAEAAISLLVSENILEVAAISGTKDYGYRPGYRQNLGAGIIGYVGKTHKTYIANDVQKDPYYFSSAKHGGSAISVPIMDEKELIGVLYIESVERNSFNEHDAQMVHTLANQVASSIQRARLYAEAQEHLRVMSTVQSISHVISSSLELDEIFETVVKILRETFGYTHASIYLLRDDYLHLGAQSGYPPERIIHKIHVSQGVTGRTITTGQAHFIHDVSNEPGFLRASDEVHSEICVPLLKNYIALGTLNVEADPESTLSQKDVELLTMLAGPIALAVDNARLHAQVKGLAMTDAVSGLFNRHVFEETLIAEVHRADRYGQPLSLIIFDLDSFKEYNDTWGHPAGDERLKAISNLIRATQRKHDISARYGGDEFAIILPSTDKEGAMQFARRLLEAAQAGATEKPRDGRGAAGYTLSMGVATFPQDGNTLASLLLAADQAELMAKRLGKNQIFSASNLDKSGTKDK